MIRALKRLIIWLRLAKPAEALLAAVVRLIRAINAALALPDDVWDEPRPKAPWPADPVPPAAPPVEAKKPAADPNVPPPQADKIRHGYRSPKC